MNIVVVGTGREGLITGALLAIQGYDVICVDCDTSIVEKLRNGDDLPFDEGVSELLKAASNSGCLYFSSDIGSVAADADIVFLAPQTQPNKIAGFHATDILEIGKQLAEYLSPNAIIVISIAVPVGTNARLHGQLKQLGYSTLDIATCPDLYRIGAEINDWITPDRIVIGARTQRAGEVLTKLFEPLASSSRYPCPIICMSPESAELTKLAAGCLLALKSGFVDEIANLCEYLDADIESVRQGMCTDRRIGWDFMVPNAGIGGTSISLDLSTLLQQAFDLEFDAGLLRSTLNVQKLQKELAPRRMLEYFDYNMRGKRIAVWGLIGIGEMVDLSSAASTAFVENMLSNHAELILHDAFECSASRALFGNRVEYASDKLQALSNADALVVFGGHKEYMAVDPSVIRRYMRNPFVFDTSNCLHRDRFEWNHFDFSSFGRPDIRVGREQKCMIH